MATIKEKRKKKTNRMNSQNQLRDNVITSTSRKQLSWRKKKRRSGLAARYISTVNQIAIHIRYYYIYWSTTWMRHTVTKSINTLSANSSSSNSNNQFFFKRLSSSWSQRSNSIWRCICCCIILDLLVSVLVSQASERFKIFRIL